MTKKERTSCVFDHVLFFEFKDLTKEEIQAAIVKVGAWSSSMSPVTGCQLRLVVWLCFAPAHACWGFSGVGV